jgi:hypothetical protein
VYPLLESCAVAKGPLKGVKGFKSVKCPSRGHVKDSLLALARYQNPRQVMFWYGFEPVVNYSVKPLTSVGGTRGYGDRIRIWYLWLVASSLILE